MNRSSILAIVLSLAWLAAGCGPSDASTPIPPTATATQPLPPTATSTPTATATATNTPTATATATPSATSSATLTPGLSLSCGPWPDRQDRQAQGASATATATPSPSPTPPAPPPPTASPNEILIGRRDGRMVHIGFDVEGDPRILYEILDVLEEANYRTTFFLQGEWVKYHPEATRRIAEAGHELGNHSWSHRDMRTLDEAGIEQELKDTEALVLDLTGRSTQPFFRPPYGLRNALVREVAYRLGYTAVIWTFGGQDWAADADADSVYHNIVDYATPGAIFYLHTSHAFDPPAVQRAIQTLREQGYRLVSLGELVTEP